MKINMQTYLVKKMGSLWQPLESDINDRWHNRERGSFKLLLRGEELSREGCHIEVLRYVQGCQEGGRRAICPRVSGCEGPGYVVS